ncbi:MAG TPA: molybdenum ABC transporter ATP-binding protein [Planctomycetota bacterium]|nr:molybdenum ABC transporter ATP-binding protein [Planctomycetota bacterium]
MSARLELRLRVRLAGFELELDLASDADALGLFGPSGAGKTSALEVVAGWRRPSEGIVRLSGRTLFDSSRGIDLAPERRGVGYVPQDLLLFEHWSVRENIAAGGARASGAARGGILERAARVLELDPLLERSVATLSGGERQRVALARALGSGPDLLLLDEPLGSLDLPLRRRILPYILRVREEFGTPMVLVSHDPLEVGVLCDVVCVLREGRQVARGRPAEVLAGAEGAPAVGAEVENVLRGRVGAVRGASATLELGAGVKLEVPAPGLEPGGRAVVALRADDVLVATRRPEGLSARNVLPARVRDIVQREGRVLMTAELGPGVDPISVELTPESTRELGLETARQVFLIVKTRSCRVMAALPPSATL